MVRPLDRIAQPSVELLVPVVPLTCSTLEEPLSLVELAVVLEPFKQVLQLGEVELHQETIHMPIFHLI